MNGPQRRYRIVKPVGKGGFGTVYHAQLLGEGGFTKDVAVKLMNEGADEDVEELAARHRDEARLLGLIRHRAILQVDGLVRLNGTWAVVMEFVDGANLHQVLKAAPMPLSCAVEMAAEVADALRVAHNAKRADGEPLGLVHRDIKPGNIQMTTAGEVKLLDFGIARASFDTRETETVGVILGTIKYMAPERLDGIDGPEGDIYALGVVLVEAATRKKMSKTSASRERHAETVRNADQLIEHVLGEESQGLRSVVRRMLAYDAQDRPTAAEAERLLRDLQHQSVGPRLSEWGPSGIAKAQALAHKELESELTSGDVLTEQSRTMMLARDDEPSSSTTLAQRGGVAVAGGIVTAAVLLVAFGLVGLIGLGVAWQQGLLTAAPVAVAAPDPEPPLPEPEPPAPEPEPEPEPEPVPEAEPEPVPEPAPAAPTPRPQPVPKAAPTPRPAEPEMAPAPRTDVGTVRVEGEGATVTLQGDAGTFPVGKVPAGSYQVQASFGGDPVSVGRLVVVAGQAHTIRCVAAMRLCRLQ